TRRLRLLTRWSGAYEHEGQPDLAAVLSAGLRSYTDPIALGEAGAAQFAQMLAINTAVLSPGLNLALYLLAAEVAVSDDPLTLRRRANVFLRLLEDAYHGNTAEMSASFVAAEQEVEGALVILLSLKDQLRAIDPMALPREAGRLTLTQTYHSLIENVF